MVPSTCPAKQISGGQQEEGFGVVHQVQEEHHQTYLLHHYQNATIQDRQIQCRKDQTQVSYAVRTWWNRPALFLLATL